MFGHDKGLYHRAIYLAALANMRSSEGAYVDGKRHGHWVMRGSAGGVAEGPFVDGKQHGHWVVRLADGTVWEGSYVDGKKHGPWVVYLADGDVAEGAYVDGKRHGRWVWRFEILSNVVDGAGREGALFDQFYRLNSVFDRFPERKEKDHRHPSRLKSMRQRTSSWGQR